LQFQLSRFSRITATV